MTRTVWAVMACGGALAIAALGGGCDLGGCTEAGCQDGLTIAFEEAAPARAVYVVEGKADGAPFRCEFETSALDDPEQPPRPGCSDERITISQWASYGEPGGLAFLEFARMLPRRIELSIRRGDVEAGAWTLEPRYGEVAPNGYECGPVCTTAIETVPF